MTRTTTNPSHLLEDPEALTRHHLAVVRSALSSDRAIAGILDVDPAQVSRWRQGQIPTAENADRLAALSVTVELLSRWLDRGSIPSWLQGTNGHLGDRSPAFMIRNGHLADVIAAVEAERAGAYV